MNAQTIAVDLQALATLEHECTGCSRDAPTCCAQYDICIRTDEMQRIIGYMPQVAAYCPALKTSDGYDNIFEKIDRNLYRIDTSDNELCILAYHDDQETRCSLHRVALDLGLPINALKPESCRLWPLALSAKKPYSLSIHMDAFRFPCNRLRPKQKNIPCSIIDILTAVFGRKFAGHVIAGVKAGASFISLQR
jgi:hypothetical protein